jgi:primosomal protein N' (replication factor Y)
MERRNERFRYIFSIYCKDRKKIQKLMEKLCQRAEISPLAKRIRWSIDIDPQDIN